MRTNLKWNFSRENSWDSSEGDKAKALLTSAVYEVAVEVRPDVRQGEAQWRHLWVKEYTAGDGSVILEVGSHPLQAVQHFYL